MKDLKSLSLVSILEKSSRLGLGRGNLGALMARAGVGKTACLIHIAIYTLLQNEKLVHISLETPPDKVSSYYNVIFKDLVRSVGMRNEHEMKALIDKNRMILAYLNQSFHLKRLRDYLKNLRDKVGFLPYALIVDGLDFSKTGREVFEGFKEIAVAFQVEIWFSALTHREISEVNERGIPFPCSRLDDLFSIIFLLQPVPSAVSLKLLKDHDQEGAAGASILLDPNTFLVGSGVSS
jgi:hypothetical protein